MNLIQITVSYLAAAYLHLMGKTSFLLRKAHPLTARLFRNKTPVIFAFWHNQQVLLAYTHRGTKFSVMVSRSKDGEYIAQVMKRMGLHPVRGSSSKGGPAALKEMIARLEGGQSVGFTPDGPKGPLHTIQMGVVAAAKVTGVPILPTTGFTNRKKEFNSWDQFQLPLPFGTQTVYYGAPIYLTRESSDESAKKDIHQGLMAANEEAKLLDQKRGGWWSSLAGSLLMGVYSIFSVLLSPIWIPLVLFKFGFSRGIHGLKGRMGLDKIDTTVENRFWFHCASLGEWQALRPFLKEFRETMSFSPFITVSTNEAKKMIRAENPDLDVHLIPADLPWVMKSWVQKVNPQMMFIVETEIWPHLIHLLHKKHVPIVVINGRLSNKSVRGWSKIKPFISRVLEKVSLFLVRTEEDGRNFSTLGALDQNIHVVGNFKVDNILVQENMEKDGIKSHLFGFKDDLVFVGGSTWPTEEETLLKLWKSARFGVRLVLAPRRFDRIKEVERIIQKSGKSWTAYSRVKKSRIWTTDILLVDTMGDLKSIYSAADGVFIGGSLYPKGGQNPLEPASVYSPLVFGPSMENFHSEARGLLEAHAAYQGQTEAEVLKSITQLLNDSKQRKMMGQAAAHYVLNAQGVTKKAAELLKGSWT